MSDEPEPLQPYDTFIVSFIPGFSSESEAKLFAGLVAKLTKRYTSVHQLFGAMDVINPHNPEQEAGLIEHTKHIASYNADGTQVGGTN